MAAATTLPMLPVGRPTAPRPQQGGGALKDRWWFLIVAVVALTIFSATDTGRIIFDSKLGVDLNASEFLVRLWSLWNPLEWFGSLQDQYVGYAIPMAPFFLAGQLAARSDMADRAALACPARDRRIRRLVKLARALQIGSDGSRLLASAVFALWPTFTILIGSTSAAVLPGLDRALGCAPARLRRGPLRSPRPGAASSGVAIAAMGGSQRRRPPLAVLLLPALYILTHTARRDSGSSWPEMARRGRRRHRLVDISRCCCRAGTHSTSCRTSSSRRRPRGQCRQRPCCAGPAPGPPTSISAAPPGWRPAGPRSVRLPAILASAVGRRGRARRPGPAGYARAALAMYAASGWSRCGAGGLLRTARRSVPRAASTPCSTAACPVPQPIQAGAGDRGGTGPRLCARDGPMLAADESALAGQQISRQQQLHGSGGRARPRRTRAAAAIRPGAAGRIVHERAWLLVQGGRLPGRSLGTADRPGRPGQPAWPVHLGRHNRRSARAARHLTVGRARPGAVRRGRLPGPAGDRRAGHRVRQQVPGLAGVPGPSRHPICRRPQ